MNASVVRGAATPALLECTIGEQLAAMAAARPQHDALVVRHQGIRWSWRELLERSDALATGLMEAGLQPGDRVGIWAPNCAEWTLAQFATARAGLILVTINPAYRVTEVEYALNKVQCAALITAPAFKTSDYLGMLRELGWPADATSPGAAAVSASVSTRLPHLRFIAALGETAHAGFVSFNTLANCAADTARLAAVAAKLKCTDAVNIQFTSGTTGFPKGATLTHRNILNNGRFVGEAIGLTPADRLCIPVPLYHCFGMVMGNLAAVTHGATMVYPAESFDPLAVLQTVASERCTALYGVPTMFIALLNHPQFADFDLTSLRTGIMAGSPCPIATMKEVIARMHMHEVTIAYGMTETSPVSFQTGRDDPLDERVSTVGRVQPHLEVKIVDAAGNTVPRGVPGELCTRGYSVMLGYWGDPEKTAEAVDAEGWMHTGDLATLDEQGYCRITGRSKDMVIRGGENVYPREIEEYLLSHPAVADAQVIGVPDERYGEEVCAWVVVRTGAETTAEALREYCRGRIAHYKVPRYVRLVDGFPMTVTGKVQKYVMRQETALWLGIAARDPGQAQ
jgi:fatty-acyl-CoA synthase